MYKSGFDKFYWGFFFTMIDFRLQGIDILPDIIGYIFFAFGLSILAENGIYFVKAKNLNIPMMILSLFSLYEKPNKIGGVNIQFAPFGVIGVILGIVIFVLGLLVVYYIFMGIKDMAQINGQMELYDEADRRWSQFLMLQFAVILAFILIFIPPLAVVYIIAMFIVSIILTIKILHFMKKCGDIL